MPHTAHHDLRTWSIRLSVAVSFVAMTIVGVWAVPQVAKSWKIGRSAKLLKDHRHEDAKELLQSLRLAFPQDPEVLLRLARVYRRLGEFERMSTILREAAKYHAPSRAIELESTLAKAQVGHLSEVGRRLTELLVNPGDDGPDICEAYVNGYFLLNNVDFAFRIIEAWKADYPLDPQPFFLRESSLSNWESLRNLFPNSSARSNWHRIATTFEFVSQSSCSTSKKSSRPPPSHASYCEQTPRIQSRR